MEYEWDDRKEALNREMRGLGFDLAEQADWDDAFIIPDRRVDYGEERFIAYVPINTRLHAIVYTQRGRVRRIISLRKANLRERKSYDQARF